jgi:hypothetical protein
VTPGINCTFPSDFVDSSIQQGHVHGQIVSINISAANVAGHTVHSHANQLGVDKTKPTLKTNPLSLPPNRLPTPVNVDRLEALLKHYPEKEFIINGFKTGFSIHYEGPQHSFELPNNKSALDEPDVLLKKIATELQLGRVAGPFHEKPFNHFIVSPLGLVAKKEKGEFRLIHDLSQPRLLSVNSFISDCYASVNYETFDKVVELINVNGRGALLAKSDIQDAFRIIPINPCDYHLLGFKINDMYYYDKVLPMGCRVSCNLFETFSRSLQWVIKNIYRFQTITHCLDDFVFVGPKESFECMRGLIAFERLAKYLNVPLKRSKTVYPSTSVVVYGIHVCTLSMQARLPPEKINKALHIIEFLLSKTTAPLKVVQKCVGLLNFCARCVKPGRAFLRRLWDLLQDVPSSQSSSVVLITPCAKQDLKAWQMFLMKFNGITLISTQPFVSSDALQFFTDASQKGFGCVFMSKWFYGAWEQSLSTLNIVILELFPIVMAVHVFHQSFTDKHVVINTDNLALVHIINNQTSKCKVVMMLVRRLVVQCLLINATFKACHLSSSSYKVADLLSRLKVPDAKLAAPHLDNEPVKVPLKYLPCSLLRPL